MITELVPQLLAITAPMEITTEALQAFLDGGGEIIANHYGIRVHGTPLVRYTAYRLTLIVCDDQVTLINCAWIRGFKPAKAIPLSETNLVWR